jgi:hypothetical protein
MGLSGGPSTLEFEGVFTTRSKTRIAQIEDGTSNTLLYGEAAGGRTGNQVEASYSWMGCGLLPAYPGLVENNAPGRRWYHFSSEHPGVVHFALADGGVRRISTRVDYGAYIFLSGMRDHQQIAADAAQ